MSHKRSKTSTETVAPTDKVKIIERGEEGSISHVFRDGERQNPHKSKKTQTEDSKRSRKGEREGTFRIEPEVHHQEGLAEITDDEQESGFTREVKLHRFESEAEVNSLEPKVAGITSLQDDASLSSEQIEILRRYISLKESEVRDLRDQQKQYQDHVRKSSAKLEKLTHKNRELLTELETASLEQKRIRQDHEKEKRSFEEKLTLLKSDYEERIRQMGTTSQQAQEFLRKKEEWKTKIKEDLRKVRLKERELENKYELLKRDTQTLLDSKDSHLLELKKKNDALDLELESLDERLRQNSAVMNQVSGKKRRLIETLRLAISLLDEIDKDTDNADEPRKAG